MKISYTNLWDITNSANLIVVTTNSYLSSSNGHHLVMGKGAAKQAAMRYDWLPLMAHNKIKNTCGHLGVYGFIEFGAIGLFQVKRHFEDKADLEIIKISSIKLANYYYDNFIRWNTKLNIHMNYPAIGYGHLRREQVEPILQSILPDDITLHINDSQKEL